MFDCHCNFDFNRWLEPLLNEIADNYRNVPFPLTDSIDADTFEYKAPNLDNVFVRGFDFDLHFAWRAIPEMEQNRRRLLTEPIW